MSCYRSKELMDVAFVPPLGFHRLSKEDSARYDALQFGLPFELSSAYLEPVHVHGHAFPCRRLSCFPFHAPHAVFDYAFEPAFIQKRNERERHRVRCVNEGYARLREHLPQEFEDKRLSKVETLRAAIDYIKHLQSLLDLDHSSGRKLSLGDAHRRMMESSDGESPTSCMSITCADH
ncbi:achaete-scute homolog 4-like [Cololabis saira]|uniref:achaete-scute homolog 4-like n=1 Tax=Cololabis saira TaxID=129043 RepID=UPI002AD5AF10|nr:achaete-scute homolog 4-like [Cololabis saira]